jgi:hypothetical protein
LTELFPGSKVGRHTTRAGLYEIELSADARAGLANFIQSNHPPRGTQLHVPGERVAVAFDVAAQSGQGLRAELIDLTHPLVLWLREQITTRGSGTSAAVAVAVDGDRSSSAPGTYIFATDLWRLEGLHKQVVLRHLVTSVQDDKTLEPDEAERLIYEAARSGERVDMHGYEAFREALGAGFRDCEDQLSNQFSAEAHAFQLENEQRVRQAEIIAEERAAKRLRMLEERLASQRASSDEKRRKAIPLTEGQIRRLLADREQRLARIGAMRHAHTSSRPVAGGIIIVS